MSNDRNDNFEGHEESEYHFSDDEASYEVESETPKAAPAAAGSGEQKESLVARLAHSKRMIISLGVFLVLVFVAYKMVGQSSSVPATDITATPIVAAQPSAMPANQAAAKLGQPSQVAATAPIANQMPVVPVTTSVPAVAGAVPGAPVVAQVPGQPAVVNSAVQMAQQLIQSQAPQQQPGVQQPAAATMPGQQNIVTALPSVIPVQSTMPAYNGNQPGTSPSVLASMGAYIDAKSAALNASSQKAIDQLQGQYNQQVTDFTNQNKALQDQVQTLNSRLTVMESQLNQLVQVLTRRGGSSPGSSMANQPAPPPVQQVQAPDVKIAYNVQAIIPGRAWLKSDNGETLTVAEGDNIKDVGRVTKIDPYDGVVEINTGTRAVSLSYGNGG